MSQQPSTTCPVSTWSTSSRRTATGRQSFLTLPIHPPQPAPRPRQRPPSSLRETTQGQDGEEDQVEEVERAAGERKNRRKDSGAIMLSASESQELKSERDMQSALRLPAEIMDLIVHFLAYCPRHPWARRDNPCANWHTPPQLKALLQLRLVNRSFAHRLTPMAFHHLVFTAGVNRQLRLSRVSRTPELCSLIKVLRLEIAPRDLGKGMRRVNSMPLIAPVTKLHRFFEVLRIYLVPVLRRFGPSLRTLHLTAKYDGLQQPSAPVKLHLLPKGELFLPCFAALCDSVRAADMAILDDLTLGLPYDGGHTSYFEELQHPDYVDRLRGVAKTLRSASIKVFDHQGNFTTMPFF